MALETEMPPFPKTYQIVRGGSFETVVVGDVEALLELRTELELVFQLGAGATPEMIAALDVQLDRLTSQELGQATLGYDDVTDMRSIVTDAKASANLLAIASIDAGFPEIKGVLNMAAIKKESEQFHQEVAEVIGDAPVEDADALAESFAKATAEETSVAQTSQADGSEPVSESEDIVVGEQQIETAVDALAELAAEAGNELDAIASDFEEAAGELADLNQTMQETVSTAESPDDENQDITDDIEDLETGNAEQANDTADSDIDDAFEALAQASEANMAEKFGLDAEASGVMDQEMSDPFVAAETKKADGPAHAVGVVDSLETVTVPVTQTFSASVPASQSSGSLRGQLEEIKRSLLFQIDRLAEVLDEANNIQEEVRQTARQASKFRQAADQAQAASQQFAAAQAEADQAKSKYEQAENRVAEARRAWEAAHHVAAESAQHIEASI